MKTMETFHFIPIFSFFFLFSFSRVMAETDTITQSQSLRENQTLVSNNRRFELGLFSPGNTRNRYLGIWYKDIPGQTVVWVANRESPVTDMSMELKINNNSQNTLILTQKSKDVLWSMTASRKPQNPVLQLLDSGNLVLREQHDENEENYLWQSFDYPSDTLLPGMKIGKDLRSGLVRRLTAWKDENDPSPGTLNWGMDITGWPQLMQRIGSKKQFNSGPWNGLDYTGKPTRERNAVFEYIYFSDQNEVYYRFSPVNRSARAIIKLNQTTSKRQQCAWDEANQEWKIYVSIPRDYCDGYAACGPNGNCDQSKFPAAACDCLRGFKPKSPQEWNGMNYEGGCVRDKQLKCQGDQFVRYVKLKVPDTENSWMNQSMNLVECRDKCLRNCSCKAYTNPDIRGGGSGCVMWFGDLIDLRIQPDAGQDLYVRVPASEFDNEDTDSGHKVKIGVSVGGTIAVLCGLLLAFYFICKRRRRNETSRKKAAAVDHFKEEEEDDPELPLFELSSIVTATDNFSANNKLGEGGFGPVYKGTLENGQEIAVKRLSTSSGQGLKEFKNEIALISKLQHRNLVKLHGCCIHDEEKLLVYEYMPNKSLDFFIFDQTKRMFLDWSKRFNIICGIARGLLYLHQDSVLRIIHRDLKASNVLLDNEMNPKISDFGLARILGGDQSVETTRRVVGTYGYMAPEYAIDGNFSAKSDVFSFGVMLLEIVSGKKNKASHQQKESTNLIGYAWDLWTKGRPLELIGEYLMDSFHLSEAMRCIHIGLLCLQQHPNDRPSMSYVVKMLGTDFVLPQPQQPALFVGEYSLGEECSSSYKKDLPSVNELSITVLEAR